jgi:hypothetical protein
MPEDQAPRRNPHLGTDCPSWCETDHSKSLGTSCVGSGSTGLDLGRVWARAVLGSLGPQVAVDGLAEGGPIRSAYIAVELRNAENLATFVELLADMPPADVCALAGAIRKAAADITGGGQP